MWGLPDNLEHLEPMGTLVDPDLKDRPVSPDQQGLKVMLEIQVNLVQTGPQGLKVLVGPLV